MATVTIHLQRETEQCLVEKAKQDGQTLESYLEQLLEHHIRAGIGVNESGSEADEQEGGDRPWRGVFVPPRPRNVPSSRGLPIRVDQLPKRPPSLDMSWHRARTDDE